MQREYLILSFRTIGILVGVLILFNSCKEEEIPFYNLYLDVNIEEAGTAEGAGEFTMGTEVSLKANPAEGYEFVWWSEGDSVLSEQSEFLFVMPGNDLVFTANFQKTEYQLTVNIVPEDGGTVEGVGEYFQGDPVTLVATSNSYYNFLYWTDFDGEVLTEDAEYSFVMPLGDKVINAIFERPKFNVSIYASPEVWGSVEGAGYHYWGDEVSINANAIDNVSFKHWTDKDNQVVSTQETYQFIMPEDSVSFTAWFELNDGFVADIDYNIYPIVTIGSQQWLGKNLMVSRYNDGTPLPSELMGEQWQSTTEGALKLYSHQNISGLNSDEEVLQAYGYHYNWYAAIDPAGLCPAGWSVPTIEQWQELINHLIDDHDMVNEESDGEEIGVGNALKSCRQTVSPLGAPCQTSAHPRWETFTDDFPDISMQVGLDIFGFAALPAGVINFSGNGQDIGESVGFWSTTPQDHQKAYFFSTVYVWNNMSQISNSKYMGLSVRCIKD
ncbi:MAG: hypothetical protein EA361_06665 [Bacteroidetes bacterium]|nr:MAG: hypothetical protein EA361_06665 [Bacteroidota bacterium]